MDYDYNEPLNANEKLGISIITSLTLIALVIVFISVSFTTWAV